MANPASNMVAANLADAASSQSLQPREIRDGSELTANVSEPGAEHVVEPTALGFNTTGWVGIAALVVLIGMLIVKVPAKIAATLDKQIAGVRAQLDEAKVLRAQAEALRTEYEAKARAAEADAATMRQHAQQEAHQIIAKAKHDAEELMARRTKTGGLSGAPLASLARQRLTDVRAASGGGIALIAAGGIDSGAEAYARIRGGASLVQLYSALVFEGPGLARRILRDLDALLARDGFASVADAVGA